MKTFLLFAALFPFVALHAQTGPGGVGTTTGTSSLKSWYRVDNGLATTGGLIDSWTNSAGVSALSVSETGTRRPNLVTNALNGYGEVSFSGGTRLVTATGAMTTTNFVTSSSSTFIVTRADDAAQTTSVYMTDPLVTDRFSAHIPWGGTVIFDIGDCCGNRLSQGSLAGLTSYSIWGFDAINALFGKQMYRNGSMLYEVIAAALTYGGHATQRLNIGGATGASDGYTGDVTELIIYNSKVTDAQRLIIQNYLAAKYGIALADDDLYTMDEPGNGNFDHDVAGIGRTSNIFAAAHADSRGTGIVRMSDPSGLQYGSYFFWGHNNQPLQAQSTDIPAGIAGRFKRVWRGQEVGTLTGMDVDFDLTGLGAVVTGQLRLLVDTDNDGVFADETPISGASSLGSNIYRFDDVSELTTGAANATRRFTLGTTNLTQTPLPITLISFEAMVTEKKDVELKWVTAQEFNNAFFTLERSQDGLSWEEVKTIPGKGNSNEARSYSSIDENPYWGLSYYRLKQTDFDGTFTFSNVKSATLTKSFEDIEVYPIPATETVFVDFPPAEHIVMKLSDQLGREHLIFPRQEPRGVSFDVSLLTAGVYFLRVSNGKESEYRKIMIE